MSKRAELPQSRHHVLVFDEDWHWLETNYGQYSANRIGAGVAIRKIVHYHIKQLRQKAQDLADQRAERGANLGEAGSQAEGGDGE